MESLPGKIIAIDNETDGLHFDAKAFYTGWASNAGYVKSGEYPKGPLRDRVFKTLMDPEKIVVFHNGKFDLQRFIISGFDLGDLKAQYHDTLAQSILLNEQGSHKLVDLARQYLGADTRDKLAIELYIKKHGRQFKKENGRKMGFHDCPLSLVRRRVEWDARHTLLLFAHFRKAIEKDFAALYQNELDLIICCTEMELRGVHIDLDKVRELRAQAVEDQDWLQRKVNKVVGRKVILKGTGSKKELLKVITKDLGWKIKAKTEKGNPSFDEPGLMQYVEPSAHLFMKEAAETLSIRRYIRELRGRVPERKQIFPALLIKWRESDKMISTYYDNFLDMAKLTKIPRIGVIHPRWNSLRAITGRFSSSEPNLQNIPRILGPRQCFLCRKGYNHYHYDYDQIEIKLLVHYAKDKNLRQLLLDGGDMHMETAKTIFKKEEHEITKEERKRAKTVNFGLNYGARARKIKQTLQKHGIHVSESEARSYVEAYYARYPSIRRVMGSMQSELARNGYIRNEYGRKFRVPQDRAYKSLNAIIQGCAADIMKFAMIRAWKYLKRKECRSRIIMTIHDEIVFEIHDSEKWLVPRLKKILEADSDKFFIPITCSIEKTNRYWSEKKEITV